MPQHTHENSRDSYTQTIVLLDQTASMQEKLKKTAKCSTRTGTHQRYVGSQTPVRIARASQVPSSNTSACDATKTSTPTYLPASKLQRGTGFTRSTLTAPGSRNA